MNAHVRIRQFVGNCSFQRKWRSVKNAGQASSKFSHGGETTYLHAEVTFCYIEYSAAMSSRIKIEQNMFSCVDRDVIERNPSCFHECCGEHAELAAVDPFLLPGQQLYPPLFLCLSKKYNDGRKRPTVSLCCWKTISSSLNNCTFPKGMQERVDHTWRISALRNI